MSSDQIDLFRIEVEVNVTSFLFRVLDIFLFVWLWNENLNVMDNYFYDFDVKHYCEQKIVSRYTSKMLRKNRCTLEAYP